MSKSTKALLVATALVLIIWVVSAAIGAKYLMTPPEGPPPSGINGQTIALVVFAMSTTTIWLGLLAAVLWIAWKRYIQHQERQQQPPHQS